MNETTKKLLDDYIEACFEWAEKSAEWVAGIKSGAKAFDSSNPPPPPPPPPNH